MATNYESDSDESIPEVDLSLSVTVQPYMYEPVVRRGTDEDPSSSDSDSESDEDELPTDMNWCSCGHCSLMGTAAECRCCRDFNIIDGKIEAENLECITSHEGFLGNCLNRWVLEASYYEYLEDNGPLDDDQFVHELYRYLAYRRFARLIWRRLGRKNRKILPSCVVEKIREAFPSQQYCGFQYPK